MSAHISSPWEIVETPDAVIVSEWHIKIGPEMLLPFFPYKRQWSEDRQQSGLVLDHEKMAAARLAAAAPDMLDALRRAVLALAFAAESSDAMRDDYNAVSAAIEKATGN